jgi:hypothetical protein
MPLYYFDIDDGQGVRLDDEGAELASLEAARQEAIRALVDLARDARPAPDRCDFSVKVRDEEGAYCCAASLSLQADWLPVERQSQQALKA